MRGRMALQAGIEFAEGVQFFGFKIAGAGEGAVPDGGDMSVRKKEEVFMKAIHGEIGFVFHDFEVEGGEEVGAAEGTTGVAGLAAMHHA